MAKKIKDAVHMYRVTGDDWDSWRDVASDYDVARDFVEAGFIEDGGLLGNSWPDLDMLPFGWLSDPNSNQGSHRNSSLTLDEEKSQIDNTDQAQTSQKRKTRGPTRCLSLQSLPSTERIELTWNDIGQPIGKHVATFNRYCGIITRDGNTIPIDCVTWKHVSKESKRRAFEIVKEKYLLTEEHYDYVVNKVMSKKWRDHKTELKKKNFNELDPHGSVPPFVIEAQWHILVEYWLSEAGKKASEINKKNRQKQVLSHTTGTKTFARVRDEMTSDGITLSRAELFIKTHSHKDGMPVNEVAVEKIAKMQEIRSTAPEGSIDSTGRDDIFSQVMGPDRHGRVRGYGLGPTPTRLWGTSSTGFSTQSFRPHLETIKELQEQMIEKNNTIEELQAKVTEMEDKARQTNERSKNMEEMMLEMRNRILQIEQDRYTHGPSNHN